MKYLILCLLLLAYPASAYLQIAQGDRIYMNETLDIRQAVSYPKYQIVWCAPNNFDCDPPDQLIDTETGSLKKYWIDPKVFHYGTYYRWDGKWHRAENSVAFTILPGKRPKNVTSNQTPVPAEIIKPIEGPYHYLIARGDSPTVYSTLLNQNVPCHLWIFSNTMDTYNLPMSSENSTYSYQLNESQTFDMNVGDYSGYIQCDGNNGWQDIYLDNDTLDTPYDDRKVPDVSLGNPSMVKKQLDDLSLIIPRYDDDLIPIIVTVTDPTITVTDVQQDEKRLYISGTTSWGNNSPITLKLDPDNYKLSADIALHTWQTFTTGSIDAPRTFTTALPFDRNQLFIGVHEIVSTVDKKGSTATSSFTFHVSDVYIMPTPTPEPKRMIYGKDWEEIPVMIAPTTEPTVNETEILEVIITPIETENVTINQTPTPRYTITQASVPTANETIPTVPINPMMGIAAIATAIVVWGRP
jgi:hypothetical protein